MIRFLLSDIDLLKVNPEFMFVAVVADSEIFGIASGQTKLRHLEIHDEDLTALQMSNELSVQYLNSIFKEIPEKDTNVTRLYN